MPLLSTNYAFQFAYNLNSAVTFFILYNTLDVPLSANSVVTLLVNSRGWSFLRVVFSQTRNFTVIAITGWIYCIKIFFTFPWKRVRREIVRCIEYIFYHSGFLSNLRLPWNTEFALKTFTVLNIYFLSFRIFEQLALALKDTVCPIIQDLSNLRLPWKQSLPRKFSGQGERLPPPDPPPRTPVIVSM